MEIAEVHREEPASEGVAAHRIDSCYQWNGEPFRIFLEVNELTPNVAVEPAELQPVEAG
jgi:hypothetical protein